MSEQHEKRFLGFGYKPRCPNCGGTEIAATSEKPPSEFLCGVCGTHHFRDEKGHLVTETEGDD